MDYASAHALLTAKRSGDRSKRKLYHNTYLISRTDADPLGNISRENVNIVVRLHATDILTFKPNGDCVVSTGGWRTSTTKDRINRFIPLPYYINQVRLVWYLHSPSSEYIYKDGLTIHADGRISGALPVSEKKNLHKVSRQIDTYSRMYVTKLLDGKIPLPSGADCWYCCLSVKGHQTLGDAVNDTHLQDHMNEPYYVPSLFFNATREDDRISNVSRDFIAKWLHGEQLDTSELWHTHYMQSFQRTIRRYIRRRLGLAS